MDEGYGRAWTFNHKDVLASTGGPEKQWLKPNEPVKWGPNFDEDVGAGQAPRVIGVRTRVGAGDVGVGVRLHGTTSSWS